MSGPPQRAAEPPTERDSLAVHLAWEGVLVLVTVALLVAMLVVESRHLSATLPQAGYVGLVACGLALSLRTGTPNLAVGSIAVIAGWLGTYLVVGQGWSLPLALVTAVALATVTGLVLGVLVAALSVPAWAATLGAAAVLEAAAFGLTQGSVAVLRPSGVPIPVNLGFGLFLVLSVGGGVLWWLPGVRRFLGATRRAGEPGRWGGLRPGVGAVVGLTGSSFLAGLGGVALLLRINAVQPAVGQSLTTTALAAVLLGGISVFGRRAGVAGTVLGVMIVVSLRSLLSFMEAASWVSGILIGGVILAGLGVSRLLESVTDLLTTTRPPVAPGQAQPMSPRTAGPAR